MISKKNELFNWLDMRFNLSVADQSYLAQLIHDIQLEQKQLLQQTPCTALLPKDVDDACIKFGVFLYAENCAVDISKINEGQVANDYKSYLDRRQ